MAQITLRDYLQETEDAISNGRVDDALARCQHVLAKFPDVLEAQRLLGEVYLAQGHLDEAQQTFDWVLTNDPENVIVYCDRALISERKSDYDTALDCYQQAYELSRGNSQIRNEFNKLSAKAGQQGFMFSRAGLARLYMRGDLLTQAIQEWEAVLATTPDRLDARTGLLEAYWREGLYERVEQLAMQLLQDVPGCVKALLLLAYVSSAKDMQLAQDYLRKAEALDPDLVIAQDLFADVIASQPNEPFLKLLKRSPTNLEVSSEKSAGISLSGRDTSFAFSADSQSSTASLPPISAWVGGDSWSSDSTFVPLPQEVQPEQEASALPVWSNNKFPNGDSWGALDKQPDSVSDVNHAPYNQSEQGLADLSAYLSNQPKGNDAWRMPEQPLQSPAYDETYRDPWVLPQEPQSDVNVSNDVDSQDRQDRQDRQDQTLQQWNDQNKSQYAASEQADPWESMKDIGSGDFSNTWSSSPKDVDLSSPPTWLNMLTQGERRQMSGDLPSPPPVNEQSPLAAQPIVPQAPVRPLNSQEPASAQPVPKQETPPAPFSLPVDSDDDEESMFGPAWLKSLGAETIEDGVAVEPAPSAPAAESVPVARHEEQPVQAQPAVYEQSWTTPVVEPVSPSVLEQVAEPTWEQSLQATQDSYPSWEQSLQATQDDAYSSWEQSLQATQEPAPSWGQSSEITRMAQAPEIVWGRSAESNSTQQSSEALWGQGPKNLQPAQSEHVQESAKETEQNLLATLEELEHGLRSQGFIPLEQNSLSAIAQQYEVTPQPVETANQVERPVQAQETYKEPTLSSALAELGGFVQQPEQLPVDPPRLVESIEPVAPVQSEPSWITSLRATPVPMPAPSVTPRFPEEASWQHDIPVSPAIPTIPAANPAASVSLPAEQPVRTHAMPVAPASTTPSSGKADPVNVPSARKDVPYFDDMELETTMKRPAIRLQPMQPRTPTSKEQNLPPAKGRERAASKASDPNLGYRERLLKGYQHQLVGDYDEAMNDYRIIIRNAPDLLSDVVSNVRALLKLAPNYSAGYRVLGDAYMRQGEYLQAMEAYNKALTMAKKAKA